MMNEHRKHHRLVAVESPYAGDVAKNLSYAKKCMRDCLRRGEAPYASHLLFTHSDLLDDDVPGERALGIESGLAWALMAPLSAVYVDLGISPGMKAGMRTRLSNGHLVNAEGQARSIALEFRSLAIDLALPFVWRIDDNADVALSRAIAEGRQFQELVKDKPERTWVDRLRLPPGGLT